MNRKSGWFWGAAFLLLGILAVFGMGERVTAPVFGSHGRLMEAESWGLGFTEDGKAPTGTVTEAALEKFNAHFLGNQTEKVIYLTFDAGYENGNTEKILDALKKHKVPACFFVVGNYLETSPELVKRMVKEGHIVGNHTMHHPDASTMATASDFKAEMEPVEELYQKITGEQMLKYYRPPQGIYCEENLSCAKDAGYQTFFWSLAYVDWYVDDQPTKEEAFGKLLTRIHPGAVVLLHSTSSTNAKIMDELLTEWEKMGYHFASLDCIEAQK